MIISTIPQTNSEPILNAFQDLLIQAARKEDRPEYWKIAEQIYAALNAESSAYAYGKILSGISQNGSEGTTTAFFEAFQVVSSLSKATEIWWTCFHSTLPRVQRITQELEEESEQFPSLIQIAQEQHKRLQTLHQRAFHEIIDFAREHKIMLQFPLEEPFSERSQRLYEEMQEKKEK